jgi:hypothetical protein
VQNPLCSPSENRNEPDFPNAIVLNPQDLKAPAFTPPAANPETLCCTAS